MTVTVRGGWIVGAGALVDSKRRSAARRVAPGARGGGPRGASPGRRTDCGRLCRCDERTEPNRTKPNQTEPMARQGKPPPAVVMWLGGPLNLGRLALRYKVCGALSHLVVTSVKGTNPAASIS